MEEEKKKRSYFAPAAAAAAASYTHLSPVEPLYIAAGLAAHRRQQRWVDHIIRSTCPSSPRRHPTKVFFLSPPPFLISRLLLLYFGVLYLKSLESWMDVWTRLNVVAIVIR